MWRPNKQTRITAGAMALENCSRAASGALELVKQHFRTPTGPVGLLVLVFLILSVVGLYLEWTQILAFVAILLRNPWVLWASLTAVCVCTLFYSAHDAKRHARESTAALLNPVCQKLDLTTSIILDYEVLARLAQARMDCQKAFEGCDRIVRTFDASSGSLQLPEFHRRVGEVITNVNGSAGLLRELTNDEFHLAVTWEDVGDVGATPTPEEKLPSNDLKAWRQVKHFYQAADQSFAAFELTMKQRLKEKREKVRALTTSPHC